jgi:hypothetical protein
MLPRIDASIAALAPTRPVLPVEAIGDPRQELFERSLKTLVGRSLPGQVMGRLSDGSFVVKVNGTPARMQLPAGAQVGAEVPLTLVALTPRPTFQVSGFSGSDGKPLMAQADAGALAEGEAGNDGRAEAGQRSPATQLAGTAARAASASGAGGPASLRGNAALLPAESLPALEADSRQAVLSPSARLITSVLATASAMPNPPTAVHGANPVLARPPAEGQGAQVAAALKQAIDSSGLFYESHLREWSEGRRPLADLGREPQMQRALDGAAVRPGTPVDGQTAQFINLQLTSHEQSKVSWEGQLVPGQPMHWEISKDAPERQDPGRPASPTAWRSAVRFRFAQLGEINAQLVLVGDQLHLQVRAVAPGAGAALQAHAPRLADALAAAGSPLSSLNIGADGAAGE